MSPLDVDPDDLRSAIRQTVVRAGFKALVELTDDLIVVGEAANGPEAVALARSTRPDVVLMDIRMPVLDGLEATRKIASDPHLEAVRVLILTTFEIGEYAFQALRVGASGFLLKTSCRGTKYLARRSRMAPVSEESWLEQSRCTSGRGGG